MPIELIKLLTVLLFGLTFFGNDNSVIAAETPKTPATKWYTLDPGQTYHADFTLKPGESKKLTIASTKTLSVGFKTDMTYDKAKKYFDRIEHPVRISTKNMSIASCVGAATSFDPKNGSIAVIIDNKSVDAVKIVIYTAKSK